MRAANDAFALVFARAQKPERADTARPYPIDLAGSSALVLSADVP
ncbi:MAG TPA: hypothetical protein VMK32_10945 [Burkholderiaceae bacterium]|nr:hypothetical protein [Burkholderiaceae bacterium]